MSVVAPDLHDPEVGYDALAGVIRSRGRRRLPRLVAIMWIHA
jgi:hypothetical protein